MTDTTRAAAPAGRASAADDGDSDADGNGGGGGGDGVLLGGAVIEERTDVPRRFQRAETVLSYRTGRVVLVLDSLVDDLNTQACLRTAEALGVQHVWVIGAAGATKNTNTNTNTNRNPAPAATATAAAAAAADANANAADSKDAKADATPQVVAPSAQVGTAGQPKAGHPIGAHSKRSSSPSSQTGAAASAAAAAATGTLSNRQSKTIKQKAYHAGMAAANAARAAGGDTAAAEAARDHAVARAAERTARELHAKSEALSKELQTPAKRKKAANAAAYAELAKRDIAAGATPPPSSGGAAGGSGLHIARGVVKGAAQWLSVRRFTTARECIAALQADGREIWSTNLSERAVPLDLNFPAVVAAERAAAAVAAAGGGAGVSAGATAAAAAGAVPGSDDDVLPRKLAVVIGREADGVSDELLRASARHVYLPMFGFTESFNVSVACALLLQRLFDLAPRMRGDLLRADRQPPQTGRGQAAAAAATAATAGGGDGDAAARVRDRWFHRLVDKSPVSTVRWSEQPWARAYVPAEYTQPNTVPVYKLTAAGSPYPPTPLTRPLPTLPDLRPPDADKVPRVAPKMRRKMQAVSQRAVKTFGASAPATLAAVATTAAAAIAPSSSAAAAAPLAAGAGAAAAAPGAAKK